MDRDVCYRNLVISASHLYEEVKWGWQAFVAKKLDKFFSQERELEELVVSTTKSVSDQIQDHVKTLTDSMLAAVGVVVGTFVAAAFKDQFNADIFRIGLLAYTAYLIVFPGVVGLISTWDRFASVRSGFCKQKADYTKRLSTDQVNTICGTMVEDRASKFIRWFATTIAVYTAVVVLLILGAVFVPGLVQPVPGITPTPSAPAPTPSATWVLPTLVPTSLNNAPVLDICYWT